MHKADIYKTGIRISQKDKCFGIYKHVEEPALNNGILLLLKLDFRVQLLKSLPEHAGQNRLPFNKIPNFYHAAAYTFVWVSSLRAKE